MSIYGWTYWKFGSSKKETPITYSNIREHLIAAGIVITCFGLMVFWLTNYTNSDVPIWDSAISAFAWAGMWLMARRKIENWIYLNISNIISIPLLFYKDLHIYAALTIFLFIVGTSGYFKWKAIIEQRSQQPYAKA